MKVLHICKMTGVAGAETHLLYLLDELRKTGLDAEVVALTEPGNPVETFFEQAEAHSIPARREVIRAALDPTLPGRLRRLIHAGGYDIVHTHLIHADLHGALAVLGSDRPHLVTSRHNDDRFRHTWPSRVLNRWLWQRVDHGIAVSNWVRSFSITEEGAPRERITTVHYGLDPGELPAPPDPRTGAGSPREALAARLGIKPSDALLGTVCRLVPQKGIDHALRAFWYVAKAFPTAHFVVTGDGPERPRLEELARGLEMDPRVHFLGWRDKPYDIIAALDGLVVPSQWEGFGMVLLEAMALRVPIIASRVSAIPEVIVDGQTGILVTPGDEDALASAISLFLEDPYLAQEMGSAGRERLESHFTLSHMVEGVRAVYDTVLA
ncbi:MAG: glycosyltransferase family 4 protein [Anaerolineae bacterium]|nr:glycosyltransferase family 4 protein [Anaerolineae bacterium]